MWAEQRKLRDMRRFIFRFVLQQERILRLDVRILRRRELLLWQLHGVHARPERHLHQRRLRTCKQLYHLPRRELLQHERLLRQHDGLLRRGQLLQRPLRDQQRRAEYRRYVRAELRGE